MLRLCLTVSVLFGHQIAGKEVEQEMIDLCDDVFCIEPTEIIPYNNYELMEYAAFQWIETEVNGTDMKTAVRTGLDKLMKYAHFSNAADTIVPVSAPLGLTGFLVNGTLQQKFFITLTVPVQVVSPPEPTDQTVKIGTSPGGWYYVRVFDTKVYGQHYHELVMEFLNDLEQDKQSFDRRFFSISWFSTDGIMDIAVQRKEE
ncbi:heme-binding protein 1-like [Heptranchias perlo]|uniref:heme-binding protein 1-like n=1 Tax=Heptranchias perlo TaxID=212740 RepID=UPI00355A627C